MDAAAVAGVGDPFTQGKMSEKEFHAANAPMPQRGAGMPSLAEYMHYAKLQREAESRDKTVVHSKGFGQLFKRGEKSEKDGSEDGTVHSAPSNESTEQLAGLNERELELVNARRVLRQAGWATVFYLITCDILGPFNAPYAISQMGMVPGIILYIVFGAVAALTGWMLCYLFCKLDSHRYPVRTYGDLAERVFGPWARHVCSVLQGIQLILNCGIICLSNGQGLSQIAKGNLCFSVCVVIWAGLGMVIGMIRGLQNFSILANGSVWLNLLIIFLSMGFIAHSPPNIAAAIASYGPSIGNGPVVVKAVVSQALFYQVNGAYNMVFAYGGAMIFPEIMAEMRRPHDFIRGMALAQALIFSCYLLYGVYVYALQGQYTLALAYQGVSKYSWQTVGNVLALITGSIAAGLYGNIGLKVFYINVVEGLFRGPPLMTKGGRFVWSVLIFFWWSIAFVIGSAVPSVGTLSGLIAAVAIFHFTYTFPPLMMLGLELGVDAAIEDEPFATSGVRPLRKDSWLSYSRWHRGFFAGGQKRLLLKVAYLLLLLAALATDGLGLWATGTAVKDALAAGAATSFGCPGPV